MVTKCKHGINIINAACNKCIDEKIMRTKEQDMLLRCVEKLINLSLTDEAFDNVLTKINVYKTEYENRNTR